MLGWATDQLGLVWLARIRLRHCLACHAFVFVIVWPATHLSSSLSGLPRMAWHYWRWRLRRSASAGGLLVEPSHARLGHRPSWHCLAATHLSSSLCGLPRMAWHYRRWRLRRSASAGGLMSTQAMPATANPDRAATSVDPGHAWIGHRPTPTPPSTRRSRPRLDGPPANPDPTLPRPRTTARRPPRCRGLNAGQHFPRE